MPHGSASLAVPTPPRARRSLSGLSIAATAVSLLALLPVGFIAWVTVEIGWRTAASLVVRPRVGELLVNTALLELGAIPLSVVLAVTLAWLTERTDLPGARLWAALAAAPLAVPAFVHSYAWVSVAPRFHGLAPAIMVSVLAYFPFLYLPVAAQLRRLDPAIEDVAASLGDGPWRIFRRAVLPQLRIAICGGSLLIGLHLLAEFGLFALIRFDTFTTAIMDQYQSVFNGPAANMLAAVLVVCCLGLIEFERVLRGGERYARLGPGAARMPQRRRLGRWRLPALALNLAVAALALGVPIVTLGRWLIAGGLAVWDARAIGAALGQTAVLAIAGGILTTLAAVPLAWLSVRRPGAWQRLLEVCHYYVGSLPGIVIALALVTITVRVTLPLYQTLATLIFAYALLFLPRALISLRASVAQVPEDLERVAMALGRPPIAALWAVTLRLSAPGAAAGIALVALGITTELTATLMLSPNGTATLATQFWAFTSELDYAAAAPYAALMIAFSLPLTALLYSRSRKVAGR